MTGESTKTETGYNGWTNYETWVINLWIGNDEAVYNDWHNTARQCFTEAVADKTFTRRERAQLDLAEELKREATENAPDVDGFYADLLNAALSEVNWFEVAGAIMDEVSEPE